MTDLTCTAASEFLHSSHVGQHQKREEINKQREKEKGKATV
jgi:hypothetical protein